MGRWLPLSPAGPPHSARLPVPVALLISRGSPSIPRTCSGKALVMPGSTRSVHQKGRQLGKVAVRTQHADVCPGLPHVEAGTQDTQGLEWPGGKGVTGETVTRRLQPPFCPPQGQDSEIKSWGHSSGPTWMSRW